MTCPHLHLGPLALPAFRVCGVAGLIAGTALAGALAPQRDLSPAVVAAMAGAATVAFLVLALATKVLTGRETLTFYHHAAGTVGAAAAVVVAAGGDVLAYLDLVAVALAAFLACGRLGCLWVGCCHGRPGYRGVRYTSEHAAEGFPAYLVGVRLFPVQALESAAMAVVAAAASLAWWREPPAGAVLAGVTVAYSVVRFVLEFWRGDAARAYALGFSQAQWTAVLAAVAATVAVGAGRLPRSPLAAITTLGLGVAVVVVGLSRRLRAPRLDLLLRPRHVRELAEAADTALVLSATGRAQAEQPALPVNLVPIGSTSLGVQVSAGVVGVGDEAAVHYALSHVDGTLHERAALAVGEAIVLTRHDGDRCQMIRGEHGVYHLVVVPG